MSPDMKWRTLDSEVGSGIPQSRVAKTALLRMRQHHSYEAAAREDRILMRLEEIVRGVIEDFKDR